MPGEWETFYLMIGSSAAALVGLLFVVMTLSGDIDPARADTTQRTFLTPVVVNFGTIVVISAAALAPERMAVMATAIVVSALIGLLYSAGALMGFLTRHTRVPHWSDNFYYGFFPTLNHLWLLGSAVLLLIDSPYGVDAVGLGTVLLLLLSIRNAWDLARWLTFHRKG